MRPTSVDGNTGALESVGGEIQVSSSDNPNKSKYVCIGAVSVNGRHVSFWASPIHGLDPIVMVDGIMMAQSPLIPYVFDRPLQFGVQDNCNAGVVFPADGSSDPLFWDVQAMVNAYNAGEETFFGGFDPEAVSVGLSAPPYFPVLNEGNPLQGLVDLGGAIGLPVGTYQYYVAYETANGDRTNWGIRTPMIPVPEQYNLNGSSSSNYPGGRTLGGMPDPLTRTKYGIELLLRIDNKVGYSSILVARHRCNETSSPDDPGTDEVIARVPLIYGQFGIISFVDPVQSNILETLTLDDTVASQFSIHAPKAVTYADSRLTYFNLKAQSQDLQLQWNAVDGKLAVPFTKKLTKVVDGVDVPNGYDSVYNAAYRTKAIAGERYSVGAQTWNGLMGRGFAQDIPGLGNYQFPNRRDVKDGESLLYSDAPCWAANTQTQGTNPVTPTFECYEQGSGRKTDSNSVVNVNAEGDDVSMSIDAFYHYDLAHPSNCNVSIGGPFIPVVRPTGSLVYQPWKPATNEYESSSGYNIPPVMERMLTPTEMRMNTGSIFGPTYHSLGLCVYGPKALPPSVKAFTMLRTKRAGRVIAQGAAVYRMYRNVSDASASKKTNEVCFFSPEMANGLVDEATMLDMQKNPGNYWLQMVSPLGIYTEEYASYPTSEHPIDPFMTLQGGRSTDMISYLRVLWDLGQVNVGDDVPHGVQPNSGAPGGNYTSWSKWRSSTASYSYWEEGSNDGNSLLNISAFTPITQGRGTWWSIRTDQYIYSPDTQDLAFESTGFNDPVLRNWHQPCYIVNIIRLGENVPEENSVTYLSSGTSIIVNGCIGIGDGNAVQEHVLLNERIEDVLPYQDSEYRYVYVTEQGGDEQVWACVTNQAYIQANLPLVLADISTGGWTAPDGKVVMGLYDVIEGKVVTGNYGMSLPLGARVVVKYVPGEAGPIRMLGFGATISPSVFAPFDNTGSGDDDSGCFVSKVGLPHMGYVRNPRWFLPNGGGETQQMTRVDYTHSIRQWVVMFDCETELPMAMSVNAGSLPSDRRDAQQFFPAIHYVVRPMHGLPFSSGTGAGFSGAYDIDYPDESHIFNKGGFRFLPQANYDYTAPAGDSYKGFPHGGYTENLNLCTTGIASQPYDPLKSNNPGLRTFLDSALVSISDDQGEVKVISSGMGQSGQNMYLWTQHGVCRLLTNKNVLTGADGSDIATFNIANYWGTESWISRGGMGLPDQLWRLWCGGRAPGGGGYTDQYFWPDRKGWYRLASDGIDDISRDRYNVRLVPWLKALPAGYSPRMCGFFNPVHNEMWASGMAFSHPDGDYPDRLFAFSGLTREWIGEHGYRFDEYLYHNGEVLGFRSLDTFSIGGGGQMAGLDIESWVKVPAVGDIGTWKEAVRVRCVGDKPLRIELYSKDGLLIARTDEAIFGPDWIKLYDSWETFLGPIMVYDNDPSTWFLQGEHFIVKVYFSGVKKHLLSQDTQLRNVK